MRIVALVEAIDHVCCRYRLAAYRHAFAQAGHVLELQVIPRNFLGRLALGKGLDQADVVILQRKLLAPWEVLRLRRRVRRLAYDFDDALWLRDSYSPKGFHDPERVRRFRATLSACDFVIAGNEYLAHYAHQWCSHVYIIPTCVNVASYTPKYALAEGRPLSQAKNKTGIDENLSARNSDRSLRLVWIGSSSTLQGLERWTSTLSEIGMSIPEVRLKLICDRTLAIPHLPVDFCRWSETNEASELASSDVGISFVPDDPWSRGKCGLKVLQYQAAGLPVVANPVGVQAELVDPGKTGFHATTTEEWINAIRQLRDPFVRIQMGRAARQHVEQAYCVERGAQLWLKVLKSLSAQAA